LTDSFSEGATVKLSIATQINIVHIILILFALITTVILGFAATQYEHQIAVLSIYPLLIGGTLLTMLAVTVVTRMIINDKVIKPVKKFTREMLRMVNKQPFGQQKAESALLDIDQLEGTFSYLKEKLNRNNSLVCDKIEEQMMTLQQVLSSFNIAVIITDNRSKITFMNPLAVALTQWQFPAARGEALPVVFNAINTTGSKTEDEVLDAFLAFDHKSLLVTRDVNTIEVVHNTIVISKSGCTVALVLAFKQSDKNPVECEKV
jgi:nitrogen fixation/metabolism regulation signal transduction histidine kinase